MARSKEEVIAWLNSKVGTTVPDKLDPALNGQCVTLIKALLDFLGAPNPYQARGNAKDYATNLVAAGIATNGRGLLNVVVNPDMGVVGNNVYGHIWSAIDDQNWEQNGAKALVVTKNTRPISQGRQFVNLDKWIGGDMDAAKIAEQRRVDLNNIGQAVSVVDGESHVQTIIDNIGRLQGGFRDNGIREKQMKDLAVKLNLPADAPWDQVVDAAGSGSGPTPTILKPGTYKVN